MNHQRGSILIGVLWCMVLLSMVVIGVLHTSRMDLTVVKNYGDRVQAHYLALAGVERAKALLYQDTVNRAQTSKSHTGSVYNDPGDFQDTALGRGRFKVFRRAPQSDGGGVIYGVSDEESRLNINTAPLSQFTNLLGMTAPVAAAIVDWRSGTNQALPGGAESDYYLSLQPPYLARNGPYQTVRELLLVRGVTRELLLGNDRNQNAFLDSGGEDAEDEASAPASAGSPALPVPGWFAIFTVASTDKNVSASGKDRVNPQTADQAALTGIQGITPQIAQAIISYRGQHQLKTIGDLLDVTASQPNGGQNGIGAGQQSQNTASANSPNANASSGSTVISDDLLIQIADDLTLATDTEQAGLININTAPADVLVCLPGIDRPLARAIIARRQSNGYFDNVAGLLKVDGVTRDIFKQVVPLATARSETYRIVCEGAVDSTGARQRVEEIVHIGRRDIETLSYREDL